LNGLEKLTRAALFPAPPFTHAMPARMEYGWFGPAGPVAPAGP
jgi:hypothetical protein